MREIEDGELFYRTGRETQYGYNAISSQPDAYSQHHLIKVPVSYFVDINKWIIKLILKSRREESSWKTDIHSYNRTLFSSKKWTTGVGI
jgi:hypothetical protein